MNHILIPYYKGSSSNAPFSDGCVKLLMWMLVSTILRTHTSKETQMQVTGGVRGRWRDVLEHEKHFHQSPLNDKGSSSNAPFSDGCVKLLIWMLASTILRTHLTHPAFTGVNLQFVNTT